MIYETTVPLTTKKLSMIDTTVLLDYELIYRDLIKTRLEEFSTLKSAPGSRIFGELCFCILTPQSSAIACNEAMLEMADKRLLSSPSIPKNELGKTLRRVRFWKKKTGYIIKARERFARDGLDGIKNELVMQSHEFGDNRRLRNWLRSEMRGNGIGMKEASHFLRNIGYGGGLAIIDRHILRCMQELDVIEKRYNSVRSDSDYIKLEELISEFSSNIGLPLEEMDLLLWSARTGYIFK